MAVPTYFFKIITLDNEEGYTEMQAYILPNEAITANTYLDTFQTSVEEIEKLAGFILSK